MILRQRAPQLMQSSTLRLNTLKVASRRALTATTRSMVSAKEIKPSANEDPETITVHATDLVDNGRWRLCNDGKGLERVFKFKSFKTTWDFMNTIAAECRTQKHHPEWTNIYNRTHVRWTTHNPEGLSIKDVSMAKFCDQVAEEKGEVAPEPAEEGMWTAEARECCGGKR